MLDFMNEPYDTYYMGGEGEEEPEQVATEGYVDELGAAPGEYETGYDDQTDLGEVGGEEEVSPPVLDPPKITITLPGAEFKSRSKSPARSTVVGDIPTIASPPSRPPPPGAPASKPGRRPPPPKPNKPPARAGDAGDAVTSSPSRPPPPKKSQAPTRPAAPPKTGA